MAVFSDSSSDLDWPSRLLTNDSSCDTAITAPSNVDIAAHNALTVSASYKK